MTAGPKQVASWRRTLGSFRFAGAGMVYLLRTQPNARVHLVMGLAVVALAAWLRVPALTWAVLLLAMALVLALESVNTAIEFAVDLACPERHPLAKAAKDCAAGAVLIVSIFSAIVGLILLGPPLWERLAL